MKTLRILFSLALTTAACISSLHAQSLLIRGGTLIDGTGRPIIEDAQILVRDGIIVEVRAGGALERPAGVDVVEARGKFIIPGLIDSHIHYRDSNAELFLGHGVTTVNDLGDPYHWQVALQKGFTSGRMFGPRFSFCGQLDVASNDIEQQRSIERRDFALIREPEDAVSIVKRLKDTGVDCIKLDETFSGELFSPIAQAAHASGMKVISHSMNADDSIRWGIDGVEHMVGIAVATAASPRAKEAVGRMHLEAGHKNSALYQWMEPAEFDRVIRDLVNGTSSSTPHLHSNGRR